MAEIHERIKKERIKKDINQPELAKILNVSKQTISNWENSKRTPDADTLKQLATVFDVSLDYLMGNTDIRNNKKPNFTKKDEREIEKMLDQTRESLEKSDGLMLSGNPVSPEAIESILDALEYGMRQAKRINKKYTPKKYRADEDKK